MPSILARQLVQPGQTVPPDWGLPHLGHTGGLIGIIVRRQELQMKSSPLPQPTHHFGKKKSSAISLSLATRGSRLVIPAYNIRVY